MFCEVKTQLEVSDKPQNAYVLGKAHLLTLKGTDGVSKSRPTEPLSLLPLKSAIPSPIDMPFVLTDGKPEDAARFVEVEDLASEDSLLMKVLYPEGYSRAEQDQRRRTMQKDMEDNPSVHFVKVIDTDQDGIIVAFARWHTHLKEGPKSEWDVPISGYFGEGANQDACEAFFGRVYREQRCLTQGRQHCRKSL